MTVPGWSLAQAGKAAPGTQIGSRRQSLRGRAEAWPADGSGAMCAYVSGFPSSQPNLSCFRRKADR